MEGFKKVMEKSDLSHQLTPWNSHSSEADIAKLINQSPPPLWCPKVHYRIHNSTPLVPLLRQLNPTYTNISYLIKSHLI
jgi:hypothetical protein